MKKIINTIGCALFATCIQNSQLSLQISIQSECLNIHIYFLSNFVVSLNDRRDVRMRKWFGEHSSEQGRKITCPGYRRGKEGWLG